MEGKKNPELVKKEAALQTMTKLGRDSGRSSPPHELMVLATPDTNITHTRAQLKFFDCSASLE